ncbi:MAG: CaiB/BaiF CoA-transferase family protein [Actinomycetota bacterium]|nr:CaiB/BaiF CoA-transferase family protein [Actinomycetota bacterium]MDP2288111.1 CaiB/BaiF CoA-transferase family protein [Actinomycetota bacterium]
MAESVSIPGPLAHLKVLDLSRLYPGAFASALLADMGADVLKIEAPKGGDGLRFMSGTTTSPVHSALNRGKRSLTLDIRDPKGAEIFRRLVAGADIVIDSHRPGALSELGIAWEQLRVGHPGLVWCSITGFGQQSPHAALPGHDITYAGYSGLLSKLSSDGVPPLPSIVVAIPVAALMAVSGILAAIAGRDATGEGAFVDASITDSAMWMLNEEIARQSSAPAPGWGNMAARGIYRCADGNYVTVASNEPRTWANLCAGMELPELADHRHGSDEPAAIAKLGARFLEKPAAQWTASPGLHGGVGPVNRPEDLLVDPHLAARGGLALVNSGEPMRILTSPLRFTRDNGPEVPASTPAPDLGADTDDVLLGLGLSPAEIASLHETGIV